MSTHLDRKSCPSRRSVAALAAAHRPANRRHGRAFGVHEPTRDAIRHYAHGIGDDNPLWCDPSYARQSRYGRRR